MAKGKTKRVSGKPKKTQSEKVINFLRNVKPGNNGKSISKKSAASLLGISEINAQNKLISMYNEGILDRVRNVKGRYVLTSRYELKQKAVVMSNRNTKSVTQKGALPPIKEITILGKTVQLTKDQQEKMVAIIDKYGYESKQVNQYMTHCFNAESLKNSGLEVDTRELPPVYDAVNHPKHYADTKIEVIDYIEDKDFGYHLGQVVKYVSRAGKKDPNKAIEDLKKAEWYLKRQISNLEKGIPSSKWNITVSE